MRCAQGEQRAEIHAVQTVLLLCRAFQTKGEQTRLLLALTTATSIPAKYRHTSRPDLSVKLLPSETNPTCLGQLGLHQNKGDKVRKCTHLPKCCFLFRNKDVSQTSLKLSRVANCGDQQFLTTANSRGYLAKGTERD